MARGFILTDACAELVKLSLGLLQLAIDDTQPGDQRAQVNAGCFSNALGNIDGRLPQCTQNRLGIHAADAMLPE